MAIEGVSFQCDMGDRLLARLVQVVEEISRHRREGKCLGRPPMANHAGLRVRVALPDGTTDCYVVEVLWSIPFGKKAGIPIWTPLSAFRARERQGWHVTVPAEEFVGIGHADVTSAAEMLNDLRGERRWGETCTLFIERVFGGKPMFADSEILRNVRRGLRLPEPAAPLLQPGAVLRPTVRWLLYGHSRSRPTSNELVRVPPGRNLPQPGWPP